MGLGKDLVNQGNWLFRRRSYVPLVIVVPFLIALASMRWPLGNYALHEFWEFSCLGISFLGLLVRVMVVGYTPKGTSGRVTHRQVAEVLNTTGMYSIVRHPLYLGNFLIWLGIALVPMNWWFTGFFVLAFWLYYERIATAEEDFLRQKFGSSFEEWAERTPAFFPRFRAWQRQASTFSLRNVLKREYTAAGGIVLGHVGVEVAEHLIIDSRLPNEPFWGMFALAGLGTYLGLRTIKRFTRWLHVQGR